MVRTKLFCFCFEIWWRHGANKILFFVQECGPTTWLWTTTKISSTVDGVDPASIVTSRTIRPHAVPVTRSSECILFVVFIDISNDFVDILNFTIICNRCDAQSFRLSKSHKKILKKINAFLLNGIRTPSTDNELHCDSEQPMNTADTECGADNESRLSSLHQPTAELKAGDFIENINTESTMASSSRSETAPITVENESTNSIESHDKSKVVGPDPTKPLKLKAKFLRAQRKLEKQQKNAASSSTSAPEVPSPAKKPCRNMEQTLQSLLNAAPTNGRHNLQVWHVNCTDGFHFVEMGSIFFFLVLGKPGSVRWSCHRWGSLALQSLSNRRAQRSAAENISQKLRKLSRSIATAGIYHMIEHHFNFRFRFFFPILTKDNIGSDNERHIQWNRTRNIQFVQKVPNDHSSRSARKYWWIYRFSMPITNTGERNQDNCQNNVGPNFIWWFPCVVVVLSWYPFHPCWATISNLYVHFNHYFYHLHFSIFHSTRLQSMVPIAVTAPFISSIVSMVVSLPLVSLIFYRSASVPCTFSTIRNFRSSHSALMAYCGK